MEALSIICGDGLARSVYGHLVQETKLLMTIKEFVPEKLSRNQNRVADQLVNYSRTERTTVVWLHQGPLFIEDLLHLDCSSITIE